MDTYKKYYNFASKSEFESYCDTLKYMTPSGLESASTTIQKLVSLLELTINELKLDNQDLSDKVHFFEQQWADTHTDDGKDIL